jgi:hypothetical protein
MVCKAICDAETLVTMAQLFLGGITMGVASSTPPFTCSDGICPYTLAPHLAQKSSMRHDNLRIFGQWAIIRHRMDNDKGDLEFLFFEIN